MTEQLFVRSTSGVGRANVSCMIKTKHCIFCLYGSGKWKTKALILSSYQLRVGCCCFVSIKDKAVTADWNSLGRKMSSKPRRGRCSFLPVKGNLFSKVPLLHMPVQDIIAHVGFGSFHTLDVYAAFCNVKVVLQHWSCGWLLPEELISDLLPESCSKAGVWLVRCASNLMWEVENSFLTNANIFDQPSGSSRDFL